MNMPVKLSPAVNTITTSHDGNSKPLTGGSSSNARFDYLDGIRGLAALYVLIHHAVLQTDYQQSTISWVKNFALIFEHGRYAVDLFIVVSGYCLMLPVLRNNGVLKEGSWSFFRRRARRILPTYYLAMLFSLILIFTLIGEKTGTNWDSSIPVNINDIITHLLLIQDFFTDTLYKINHTFWSISVEFHIYLLFPLMVIGWRNWGGFAVTAAAIVFSLFCWFAFGRIGLNVYGMSPHYTVLFVCGMFAAQSSYSTIQLVQILAAITLIIMAGLFYPIIFPDLIAGLLASLLLYVTASDKFHFATRIFSFKPIVFIGGFAYSIYLIHAPLLQLISQYIFQPLELSVSSSILVFIFPGTILILFVSYLFFLVAELPFLRKRKTEQPATVVN